MEKFSLASDIKTCYIQAASFPAGVLAAHQQLHALFPPANDRNYFGISYPGKDKKILYKAAAEIKPGDEKLAATLEHFVIKNGEFHCVTIHNFMDNIPAINEAFQILLAEPGIDPDGYCLEWYEGSKDVKCLVPLKKI